MKGNGVTEMGDRMMDKSQSPEDGRFPATAEQGYRERLWTAYGLWLFLGSFGAHRFYLGKWVTGFIMAFFGMSTWGVAGIVTLAKGPFWWVLSPFALWWIIDALFIPRWVRLIVQK